jgi:hypothetical protein
MRRRDCIRAMLCVHRHEHLDQNRLEARIGQRPRGASDDRLLDPVDIDLDMVREGQAKLAGEVVERDTEHPLVVLGGERLLTLPSPVRHPESRWQPAA